MKRTGRSGTTLFLIELTVAVGVFAFCAAVCLGIFARAERMTGEGADLHTAAITAQSAAECFQAAHGDLDRCAALLGAEASGGSLTVGYTDDWRVTDENAAFWLTLEPQTAQLPLLRARVSVIRADTGEVLFAISASAWAEEVRS